MTDLLSCPFCGREAQYEKGAILSAITCPCSSHVFFGAETSKKRTIDAWNTRAERTCHDIAPDGAEWFMCSECEKGTHKVYEYNYCPNCGAKVVEQ